MKINYWKATDGQYSEKSWDKPLYSKEANSAPEDCDYFTIPKEQEEDDNMLKVSLEDAVKIALYLQFKGDVRDSQSGNSWRVYRNSVSNSFDLSVCA